MNSGAQCEILVLHRITVGSPLEHCFVGTWMNPCEGKKMTPRRSQGVVVKSYQTQFTKCS